MIRHLFLVLLLVATVGLPYLSSNGTKVWNRLTGGASKSDAAGASDPASAVATSGGAAAPAGKSSAPATYQLADVLRFDVTTGWIMSRWPRVSASLAELDLQGYRVPLVTGTRADDVAGSLTYYFDKQQRVARITLDGATGDPRKLVALVTGRFGLERQLTDDPGLILYEKRYSGQPESQLKIRPARIVRADSPYSRYEVELAVKRP